VLPDRGFADLWSLETAGYDAFTPLALAAGWGTPLRLGTAVAGVFTRGPALLAQQAAALAEAAPGRFVLGIGASSPAVVEGWNGLAWERPWSRVRDTLRFLRRALAGERVDADLDSFRVRGFRLEHPPDPPPPLFLAALRPRMLRLAGAEADGAILGMLTPEDVDHVVPILRAAGGGEVVARVGVAVTRDVSRARERARRTLAAYLNVPPYARFHAWLGRGELLAPLQAAWRAGDRRGAVALVPDALVDGSFVHGPPEACREALARFAEAGVDTLVLALQPTELDPRDALRALGPR